MIHGLGTLDTISHSLALFSLTPVSLLYNLCGLYTKTNSTLRLFRRVIVIPQH